MTKLLLIDAYAVLHRAFHALPPMRNKEGKMTNAIYGFLSMLIKIIQEISPTHIVVTFDRAEKTLRRQKFEKYQSKRPDVDDGLSVQFGFARELTKALNIPSFELAGYESDDMIGTIASAISNQSSVVSETIIVTGDRDILQLVNKKVKVYMPGRRLSDAKIYGESDVEDKMGVPPSQIVDYKALVGDSSDNYPGVNGIGPRTAINLLKEFGSLENIYKNLDKVPEKTKAKLVQFEADAKMSQDLAKIYTDCKIDFDIAKADRWDLDSAQALEFYSKMGFKTLVERAKKLGKSLDEQKQNTLF